MKTKIFKLFAFVIIAQISLYACCGDEFNIFISNLEISVIDDADNDNSSVASEDFSLRFIPDYQTERISFLSTNAGFINTANATSCDEIYYRINLAEEITLTANVPLFGIPAGNSLNDHVIVEFQFQEGNQITMNELLLDINDSLNSFQYFLRFDTEIPAMTTAKFTMTVVFENDEQLTNTTTAVTFE